MNLRNWNRQPTTMLGLAGMTKGVSAFIASGCHDLPTLGGTMAASALLLVINDNTALRSDVGQAATDFTKMALSHTIDMATAVKDTMRVLGDIQVGAKKADAPPAANDQGAAPIQAEGVQAEGVKVLTVGTLAGAITRAACLFVVLGGALGLSACASSGSGGVDPTVAAQITKVCQADATLQPQAVADATLVSGVAAVVAPTSGAGQVIATGAAVDQSVLHPAVQGLCNNFAASQAAASGTAGATTPAATATPPAASTAAPATN